MRRTYSPWILLPIEEGILPPPGTILMRPLGLRGWKVVEVLPAPVGAPNKAKHVLVRVRHNTLGGINGDKVGAETDYYARPSLYFHYVEARIFLIAQHDAHHDAHQEEAR